MVASGRRAAHLPDVETGCDLIGAIGSKRLLYPVKAFENSGFGQWEVSHAGRMMRLRRGERQTR